MSRPASPLKVLGAALVVFALLGLALLVPNASAVRSAAQYLVYQPITLNEWSNTFFYRNPHFPFGYGPYRTGQAPGGVQPSAAQIEQDMGILQQETTLIRTYGACGTLGTIPSLAQKYGIHLYQGVYLSRDAASNSNEMACYSKLLPKDKNIIKGIIGNETLQRNDLTEAALISFIDEAKKMGSIPVSTGDTWDMWCNLQAPKPRCPGRPQLAKSVDFITVHIYPYWEGRPIEQAAAEVVARYIALRAVYPQKEIVVGETGWPTCGNKNIDAVPSLANQQRYIEELWKWSHLYAIPILYFEAFDEPWKAGQEGQVGACWGAYGVNRLPKHTNIDWSLPTPEPTPPSSPAVRIEYPPRGTKTTVTGSNCSIPVFGRAYQAKSGWHVKIEVYTNAWYVQDSWYANGLVPVVNGMWAVPDIYFAGQDPYNHHGIRATLVDATGKAVASDEITGIVRSNSCY